MEVTDRLADFKEPLNPAEVMHLGTQRDCGGPERELHAMVTTWGLVIREVDRRSRRP